jgi:hypothetical protein
VPDLDDDDLGMRAMVEHAFATLRPGAKLSDLTLNDMPALMAELALNERFVSAALGFAVAHVLSQTRAPNKPN